MKFFSLSILLISCIILAQAQDGSMKAISNAVEKLRISMINADSDALNKLILDDLSYGHSSGKVENKTEFMSNILNGNSDFVEITLTDQKITIEGKTAIVRHSLQAKTNDKGVAGNVQLLVMTVWVKVKGSWKLFARQAVKPQIK